MAEARGGVGEPGAQGMGLELKLEPEGRGLEVKLELAGGVEAKVEWDGLQIKVEVMDEPEEVTIDGPEVKQEFIDGVDVKQESVEGVDVKQEVTDEPEVKQEVIDGVEVKEEFVDGLDQKKQEMLGWLEEGIPVMGRVEVMGGVTVKEEVKEEPMDGMIIEEGGRVDGVSVQEEVMGGMEVKEEYRMEVKKEVDGVEVKKEGPKEGAMDGAELMEAGELPREPLTGSKRKLAMSSCETCGIEEAKYRCPRCMKCSCSLACVKKHKTELTCNGIREKTAFVSLKQFTEINLLSDYRFLEDVGRSADYIARDIFLKRPSTNKILNYMKNRARKYNIDLKILPIGFTKRRENTTVFDRKEQRFYWHLKLLFPQSHAEYVEKGVPGDKKLHEILRTYIDPEKSDPVIRQRLKAYVFSESGVQILMKIENMQHNLVRYYELDPCKSLIENLKDKVVIEYPTLHVVLKGSKSDMIILGQERNESTESFGSENPVLSSEEEGEIQESS